MNLKTWGDGERYPGRTTRPPTAKDARMSTTQEMATTGERLASIGSPLLLSGAIAYIVHIVWRSILTAGVATVESAQAALWVPVNALGVLGAALVLLGFPAVSFRLRLNTQDMRFGVTGLPLLAVSWMLLGVFLSLYGALILPWLADEAPRLIDGSSSSIPVGFTVIYGLGLLTWLVGASLIAVPIVKGPARDRWAGYLLPASAVWALVGGFLLAPDGPASNLLINLLSNLGPVLLLIGLNYAGSRSGIDSWYSQCISPDDAGGLT